MLGLFETGALAGNCVVSNQSNGSVVAHCTSFSCGCEDWSRVFRQWHGTTVRVRYSAHFALLQ